MSLIYREFKKRGWLDRARMCITIHDELVFEIDDDIVEEATLLIDELMVGPTTKKLNWTVPLKTDVEFGDDWTVPFNLREMVAKGFKSWNARWQQLFPVTYAKHLAAGGQSTLAPASNPTPATNVSSPEALPAPTIATNVSSPSPVSSVQVGPSQYVYTIQTHRLTPELAEVLARVVNRAIGRGSDDIRIETPDGESLIGRAFTASFAEFKIIAHYEGI